MYIYMYICTYIYIYVHSKNQESEKKSDRRSEGEKGKRVSQTKKSEIQKQENTRGKPR